jgi:hypothetical protein
MIVHSVSWPTVNNWNFSSDQSKFGMECRLRTQSALHPVVFDAPDIKKIVGCASCWGASEWCKYFHGREASRGRVFRVIRPVRG